MRRSVRSGAFIIALLAASWYVVPIYGQPSCTPFPLQAPVHSADRPLLDVLQAVIALRVDPEGQHAAGRATYDFLLEEPPDSVMFAVPNVRIDSVFAGATGRASFPLPISSPGPDTIVVDLTPMTEAGVELDSLLRLAVDFRSEGIQFVDSAAWALDPAETWFPWTGVHDDRFPVSLTMGVPVGWTVAAPGAQTAERSTEDGHREFLFSSPHALPARAVGFIAGVFKPQVSFADLSQGRRLPIAYLNGAVAPAVAEQLSALSSWTRYAYPFDRYSRFVAEGATPSAGAAMAVAPAFVDDETGGRPSELPRTSAATEAARQWFGGVVSASDWSHVWWEEALSSYVGFLTSGGPSDDHLRALREAYLTEAERYVRPLVWNRWNYPAELLDAHAFAKGVWVLHMLREQIGSEAFQAAVAQFVESNQFSSVGTEAFLTSVSDLHGADVSSFADQWIRSAGHPILQISYESIDDGLLVRIDQSQEGDHVAAVFDLQLTLEVGALGSTERFNVSIDERSEQFVLPFAATPRFVAVDPDEDWLAVARVDQSAGAWIAQLRDASTAHSRAEAAREIASVERDPALLLGLRSALGSETDPRVRARIIEAVGNVSSEAAERTIFEAWEDPSPLVRSSVLAVLPELTDGRRAIELAGAAAQRDADAEVQAQAVRTLAQLGSASAVDVARAALITPSPSGVIRAAGLHALGEMHQRAPGETLAAALTYSGSEYALPVRLEAVRLLRTLAPLQREAARRLADLLADGRLDVRTAAAESLSDIGAFDALLDRVADEPSSRSRALLASLLPCE